MGKLTSEENRLLAPYIRALEALDKGKRLPRTALQRHFVSVCRGQAPARTRYEKAYLKWRAEKLRREKERIERERQRSCEKELRKAAQQAKRRDEIDMAQQRANLSTRPSRRIKEWGTREDWKRDRDSRRR